MKTEFDQVATDERDALWTRFLDRWPLERLKELTLPQYNQAGEDDHFCRWVEKHTEALGSIWGGNSLKFGIYSLGKPSSKKPSAQKGVLEDGRYGWYAKYGATAEAAFAKVRQLVVQTATAAREGRLDEVEQIDLWPIFRRKIAFLYQDRQWPCMLPIYMGPMLRQGWLGDGEPPKEAVALYQGLMAQRGDRPLLSYYDDVMVRVKAAQAKQVEDQKAEVLSHFAAVPDLAPTLAAAGQTDAFCRLALAVHDAGLDWWVTGAHLIHAGRTDDPKVWQTVVSLALGSTAQGVRGRLHSPGDGADDAEWQALDADVADRLAEGAAADARVPELSGRDACWPDDYDGSDTTLTVLLTDGAVKNGYIKVPKLQALFPKNFIAADEKTPSDTFWLALPDGSQIETCVLASRNRIATKTTALFKKLGVKAGDRAVIQKEGDGLYRLLLNAPGVSATIASSLPNPTATPVRTMSSEPLNQILFGPPGTGKTYATIDRTLAVLDPAFLAQYAGQNTPVARAALKRRFDEFKELGRVRFTTFHQSFSYEDFVEGIRAHTDEALDEAAGTQGVRYRVEPGVFMQLCLDARRDRRLDSTAGIREGAKVWKLSIEEASSSGATRAYCFQHSEARIGWPQTGDLDKATLNDPALNLGPKDQQSLANFSQEITVGDVVVCLGSKTTISAVGVVTGDYRYEHPVPAGVRDDYVHKLPVHWLATGLNFNIVALNDGKQLTLQTVYPLNRVAWPDLLEALTKAQVPLAGLPSTAPVEKEPYVLIIDEINRGNVSRIFGELITLIEPSKRMGAPEALAVTLPYSKKPFFVPDNVHLIGTMNTADRSLAGLDVALRRRFDFQEMPPRPELLADVVVGGVSIQKLLETLNQRIEALLDREHVLGHAYFMPLKDAPTLAGLASIFRNKVLPLLQEYFFDDWQRIQWVLNDHRKPVAAHRFVQAQSLDMKALFGDDVTVSLQRSGWQINDTAFDVIESYLGVIQAPPAT